MDQDEAEQHNQTRRTALHFSCPLIRDYLRARYLHTPLGQVERLRRSLSAEMIRQSRLKSIRKRFSSVKRNQELDPSIEYSDGAPAVPKAAVKLGLEED